MLRPSRPMIRPFMSSRAAARPRRRDSLVCSEASRWIAVARIRLRLGSASSCGGPLDVAGEQRGGALGVVLDATRRARRGRPRRSARRRARAPRRRSSSRSSSSARVPSSDASASASSRARSSRLRGLVVEPVLALGDPVLAALDVLALLVQVAVQVALRAARRPAEQQRRRRPPATRGRPATRRRRPAARGADRAAIETVSRQRLLSAGARPGPGPADLACATPAPVPCTPAQRRSSQSSGPTGSCFEARRLECRWYPSRLGRGPDRSRQGAEPAALDRGRQSSARARRRCRGRARSSSSRTTRKQTPAG